MPFLNVNWISSFSSLLPKLKALVNAAYLSAENRRIKGMNSWLWCDSSSKAKAVWLSSLYANSLKPARIGKIIETNPSPRESSSSCTEFL